MRYLLMLSLLIFPLWGQNRSSSYPYITGDTFRAFCDHIIDETTQSLAPSQIKKGDVVFVKTDYLYYFFSQIHPRVKDQYILLTHNSDYAVPGNFAYYLDDPKLFAWFGQNTDKSHPKLITIPIGLANQYWAHGNVETVKRAEEISQTDAKSILLYINYSKDTSAKRSDESLHALTQLTGAFVPTRKPFEEYMVDLAHSIFVISPPGNGLDCHRTWESLYMGAIPIVKRSTLQELFTNLPIIIVDDWGQITEQLLQQKNEDYKHSLYDKSKIYADYWFSLIRQTQLKCRN